MSKQPEATFKKKQLEKINIKEFREKGYLQEANRLFFHPLGLALVVRIKKDGSEESDCIWDVRKDDTGIMFSEMEYSTDLNDKSHHAKASFIAAEKNKRIPFRDALGCVDGIQMFKLKEIK